MSSRYAVTKGGFTLTIRTTATLFGVAVVLIVSVNQPCWQVESSAAFGSFSIGVANTTWGFLDSPGLWLTWHKGIWVLPSA